MTSEPSRIKEKGKSIKGKFLMIALGLLVGLTTLTLVLEYLDSKEIGDAWLIIPGLILMPGFIIYVLVTGDIHGWKPGPIGQEGRLIVTILGSWLVWTPVAYFIYRRFNR